MRNPTLIDGIFIWDAPLGLTTFITNDMYEVFANQTALNPYLLIDRLPLENTNLLNKDIFIGGYNLFQTLSTDFTTALNAYPSINYTLDSTLNFDHIWTNDWIVPMFNKVNFIMKN